MSATTMPTFTLQAAFGIDVDTAPAGGDWVTVSGLRNGRISRGPVARSKPAQAGTMTVVVDNRSRQWDPDGPGAHAADLVPQLPIRLVMRWNSTDYVRFQGYLESIVPEYPGQDSDAIATLTVVDGINVLANKRLRDSVWAETVFGLIDPNSPGTYLQSAWWRLGESFGQIMSDGSGNGYHGTYGAPVTSNNPGILPYSGADQSLTFDGIDDRGIVTPVQFPSVTSPMALCLWVKMPDEIPASGYMTLARYFKSGAGWTLRLNPAGKLEFSASLLSGADVQSDDVMVASRTYFVVADFPGGIVTLYIDGVEQTGTLTTDTAWQANTSDLLIGGQVATGETAFRGVIDETVWLAGGLTLASQVTDLFEAGNAPRDGDLSGARIGYLSDAASWPSSLRDIDTGLSVLSSATLGGTAWDRIQSVAVAEDGICYVTRDGNLRLIGRENILTESTYTTAAATFGDSGSELPYQAIQTEPLNVQRIINEAIVSREGGLEQRYSDTTSAGQFGFRSVSFSGLSLANDTDAANLAAAEVLRNMDQSTRIISLTIRPGRSASAVYPVVLGADLWTRLAVRRRPQGGGSMISKEVHIARIDETFDAPTQTYQIVYGLEPVDPNEATWALAGVARCDQSNAHVSY